MSLFTTIPAMISLQLVSYAQSQFPMPYPLSQMSGQVPIPPMGPRNISPMVPIPPLPPQSIFPRHIPMAYSMPSVMPYSRLPHRRERKHRRRRRKRRRFQDDSSESHSREFKRKIFKKRRQVLTPVVSYVTKDGYVVYQKKIKKHRAKDWLEMINKKASEEEFTSAEEKQFQELLKRKKKRLYY